MRRLSSSTRALSPLLLLLTVSGAAAQPALRERMLIAEDQRASTDADLTTLKQGLASLDAKTRAQAVRGIGRLERPELMMLISRHLTDGSAEVRIEAVNAIGQLARGPEGVAGAKSRLLTRIRGEQQPRVRGVMAATLGRLAYTTAADVQQVERTLGQMLPRAPGAGGSGMRAGQKADATMNVYLDEVVGVVEGLEALIRQSGKLAAPSSDTITRLRVASELEGRPQDADVLTRIRRLARATLNAAGQDDLESLNRGARDPDVEVRRLTMIAARAAIAGREDILKKGLQDADPQVRYEAVQTWGRQLQKTSCGPVLAAVKDSNPHVRLLAIDLLGSGCPDRGAEAPRYADEAATTLSAVAQTITANRASWHAPAHALVALAKLRPDEARKLLPLYASHAVWQVRMYAGHAAGAANAVGELVQLGADENDNVREAALGELVTLKRPEAVAVALDALGRYDHQLIITAARAVAGSASAQTSAALVGALARLTAERRDTSRDPRMAILTRLAEYGAESSGAVSSSLADALGPYLSDFDAAIAARTAEILATWTGKPVSPSPKPLPHPSIAAAEIDSLRGQRLRFVMSGKGAFDLRLLVDDAPVTSLRVATRAREGYYNGLTFHRVVPNFVIQGGSPGANEYAGDALYMRDEVGLVSHRRGTVGISTRGRDTGDAQIFVNLVDLPRLDHTYTVFAEVVSGLDVVDSILEGDVIERVEVVRSSGTQ